MRLRGCVSRGKMGEAAAGEGPRSSLGHVEWAWTKGAEARSLGTDTQVWRIRAPVVGGRVPHPMVKSRNSKGFLLARRELTLVCMLVPWQGRIKRRGKKTN